MKTGETIIKLLGKYDFKQEVPAAIRERMLFSKKRIYRDIISKRSGETEKEYRGAGMKKYTGWIASAAAVVVILSGALFVMTKGYLGQKTVDETLSAKAIFVKGDVSIRRGDTSEPLKPGVLIVKGDRVITGAGSYAALEIYELGMIKINEGTECVFEEILNGGATSVSLTDGSVYSNLKKLGKDQTYKVKTPTCTASVRGTEFLTVAGKSGQGVRVLEGVVNVASGPASVDVTALRGVNVGEAGKVSEYELDDIEILKLKKESLFREVKNLRNADQQTIDMMFKQINDEMVLAGEEIAKLEGDSDDIKKLSPLDRLRKMNKALTMIYLSDGSQIAGSVSGQKNGKMKLDTGEGVIEIPVQDIVKRIPLK